ncbi:hypothetical protein BXY85_3750 [Roseivirga pacifica]|uniref:Uncharacterized protein n=1 Tax=Roseivirga pacifica TaxID=1267423 RepID=A0A1I0Q9E0_9BACT|nr:hypothetical protein BXY85_3750 [Roseivirga pacifica]SEW23486.1 hypothetical protein SAMN05216290_2125 [Roseivirga pacifica]
MTKVLQLVKVVVKYGTIVQAALEALELFANKVEKKQSDEVSD